MCTEMTSSAELRLPGGGGGGRGFVGGSKEDRSTTGQDGRLWFRTYTPLGGKKFEEK